MDDGSWVPAKAGSLPSAVVSTEGTEIVLRR